MDYSYYINNANGANNMLDNQGRNLEAVKAHLETLHAHYIAGVANAETRFAESLGVAPLAGWVSFEGVDVLRSGSHHFVAVPTTGKRNAKRFDVIDTRGEREFVCQVRADEVYAWLRNAALV